MGLDMLLTKKTNIGADFEHNKIGGSINITKNGKPIDIDLSKISDIEERAFYWRKANHIHKWFVENIQDGNDDCGEYYVSSDDIKKLIKCCRDALENKDKAAELLPTEKGFFFGPTGYDEYYFRGLEDTISGLSELDENGAYYYRSSW